METMKSDILATIPHREPFLFLEHIESLEPKKSVVAIMKNGVDEPFYRGHFPGNPLLPGVLIIEGLAQASCYLYVKSVNPPPRSAFYFGSIKIRFFKPARPGEQVELHVNIKKVISGGGLFGVKAVSNGEVLSSGQFGMICKRP